ncbi:MAG: hypothetical protein L6R37_007517 [Teloschistes peruensis]|nr:MAG: hypothetical protein L6R37_007517 [Teloschistes peruensis]
MPTRSSSSSASKTNKAIALTEEEQEKCHQEVTARTNQIVKVDTGVPPQEIILQQQEWAAEFGKQLDIVENEKKEEKRKAPGA